MSRPSAGAASGPGPEGWTTRWRDAVERPPGLRGRARAALRHRFLDVAGALSARGAGVAPALRLLYCHYVFDDQVEDFERILRALLDDGPFVDTETAVAMAAGTRPIEGPTWHLSFDDGLENVVTNALPVLRRLGVPAVFFVPSAVVSAAADADRIRRYCLDVTHYSAPIRVADWDALGRAAEQGLEIGSHTRTHARFAEMSTSAARLTDEIGGSRAEIERELGRPCRWISWPYGRADDADPRSLEAVRAAGYEACFGAFRAPVVPGETDLWAVPRHHFEAQWPVSHVRHLALSRG